MLNKYQYSKKEEDKKLRYLVIYEYNWEDLERNIEAWKKVLNEREQGSDRFPKKLLIEPHSIIADLPKKTRDMQGFFIFDSDDQMHLINYVMQYAPYMHYRFIPIFEDAESAKVWVGMKE